MKDSIDPAWLLTRSRSLSFTTSEPKLLLQVGELLGWPSPAAAATYCGTRPIRMPTWATISGYSSSANSSTAAISASIISGAAALRGMPSRVSRVVGGSST